MLIGNKIHELRRQKNLNQEQLSEKLNVSRQTISNWETNQTTPDIYQAKSLSKVFNVSLDELLENNEYSISIKNNIWDGAKEKIKYKVKSLVYDTWFKDIEFVSIDNNIITLIVPYSIHKKHLEKNYKKLVLNTINEISKIKITNVNYVLSNY